MKTKIIGIDCATQPKKVGLVLATYFGGKVQVTEVCTCTAKQPPAKIVAGWVKECPGPCVLALDAPLGWPEALGGALADHRAGAPLEPAADELFSRGTDRFVHKQVRQKPLEVGANLIARTARAALEFLDQVREDAGATIPLFWKPEFVGIGAIEVYPAATLKAHGIKAAVTKGGVAGLKPVIAELGAKMDLSKAGAAWCQNKHAVDAVVCVLAAQDFLQGTAYQPEDQREAEKEGWIWVRKIAES